MEQEKRVLTKWSVVALVWLAMVISHIIRVALGVAAPTLMRLYNIPPDVMGYILSGWNWAYTICLLPAGPLVDRFGPWIVMGIGSGVWGAATLALPLASTAMSLFLMRALFGLGHSMLIPTTSSSVSRWFEAEQRATAVGFAFSGNQVGLALGATVAAFILARLGWEAVFYSIGSASLLVTLLWFALYPGKGIGRQVALKQRGSGSGATRIYWLSLLRFRSTWGIFFGQMGYLYAYFFFMSWLPGYLILERKMSIMRTGLIGSLPFWAGMIGTLGGGWLGDYLIRRGFSRTASRKGIIGVGLGLATILVVTAAFTPQTWLAVTLLTLCMLSLRLTTASGNSTPIDLAPPTAVGSLTSIQNFGGNIGGLLAPIVTGYLLKATGSFVSALLMAGAMATLGAISYVFIMGRLETMEVAPKISPTFTQPAR
ncbi:MAG: MFS transporter [Acidobacteria bacterium]|nr:MFS transporter [Acidobacteriota bacterium]